LPNAHWPVLDALWRREALAYPELDVCSERNRRHDSGRDIDTTNLAAFGVDYRLRIRCEAVVRQRIEHDVAFLIVALRAFDEPALGARVEIANPESGRRFEPRRVDEPVSVGRHRRTKATARFTRQRALPTGATVE